MDDLEVGMTSDLDWQTVRSTQTLRAVWVDRDNAQAVAERFGGRVYVVPGFMGRTITRIEIGNTSGPVGFWLSEDGRWLREDEWEAAHDG